MLERSEVGEDGKKKAGENPVFYEDEVGLTGTVWTRDRK